MMMNQQRRRQHGANPSTIARLHRRQITLMDDDAFNLHGIWKKIDFRKEQRSFRVGKTIAVRDKDVENDDAH